jgi:hypothetical protein
MRTENLFLLRLQKRKRYNRKRNKYKYGRTVMTRASHQGGVNVMRPTMVAIHNNGSRGGVNHKNPLTHH